jgi:hypothetical protein
MFCSNGVPTYMYLQVSGFRRASGPSFHPQSMHITTRIPTSDQKHSPNDTHHLSKNQYPTIPAPSEAPTQLHSIHCSTSSTFSVALCASL